MSNFTQAALSAALNSGGTVTFSTNGTVVLTSTLVIRTNVTIDGNGGTISGSNAVGIFYVSNNVTLTLANLGLANGNKINGAGVFVETNAILNLTNCVLLNNNTDGPNGANGANASKNGEDGKDGRNGTSGIGGAIYNLGFVNITNSLISSNSAWGGHGGNGGSGGNSSGFGGHGGDGGHGAIGWGGGIYNGASGTIFMLDTTLSDNQASGGSGGNGGAGSSAPVSGAPGAGGRGATGFGGGIYNLGSLTISNSTFAINTALGGSSAHAGKDKGNLAAEEGYNGGAGSGGAIYNLGTLSIGNCTFVQNAAEGGKGSDVFSGTVIEGGNGGAGSGGAIFNTNIVSIVSCSFATNNALGGEPGISPFQGNNGSPGGNLGGNIHRIQGKVEVRNSLFVKGQFGANFSGNGLLLNLGYNLSSDGSFNFTGTSRKNINALVGPLSTNAGFTQTLTLLTNSPAIDRGDPAITGFDQRGVARPQGLRTDIGAYELIPTFSISGRITEGTNTVSGGVSGITVTAGNRSAVSGTNGVYTIFGLVTSNYVVTPTPVGAGFTPTNYTNVFVGFNAENPFPGINATNINFAANLPTAGALLVGFASTNQALSNQVFTLQFLAMPQRTYRMQASTNLNTTNWINVATNKTGTNGLFNFSQTNLTKFPQRYFRLRVAP